jgi:hypothetical protein
MIRRVVGMGVLLGLLAVPLAHAGEPKSLDFVFYQPDYDEGLADPARRQADLDFAAAHGVKHLIVQYLAHDRWSMLDPTGSGRAELQGLMDEAHARGIRVWLGTLEDPRVWKRRHVPLSLWNRVAERGLEVAREAAAQFGDHPAFAGWYWTPEVVWWDSPSPRRLEKLSLTTQQAVATLRRLTPDKPVAILLGPGGSGEGNLLGISWCRYIEAVEPDIVVVMDGVGSAHLDVLLAPALYGLARQCAERVHAQVWADIELFGPDLEMLPTFARLDAQYEAARQGTAMVGVFDLNHWMAVGTAGRDWVEGHEAPGRRVGTRGELRVPDQDWLAPPAVRRGSITLELAAAPQPLLRVEVLTRGVHPRTISLAGLGPTGDWEEWGLLEARHGPARDELTWVWEPGAEPREATEIRLYALARRFGMRIVDVRVFQR